MFWKRKPVTHAIALWILVGLAAAVLAAVLGYLSVLANLRRERVRANPAVNPAFVQDQMPSLYGTILSVDAHLLKIDSKQAFTQILFDEDTSITSVGGQTRPAADLAPGAVITATGKDLGHGMMGAAAIVILEQR